MVSARTQKRIRDHLYSADTDNVIQFSARLITRFGSWDEIFFFWFPPSPNAFSHFFPRFFYKIKMCVRHIHIFQTFIINRTWNLRIKKKDEKIGVARVKERIKDRISGRFFLPLCTNGMENLNFVRKIWTKTVHFQDNIEAFVNLLLSLRGADYERTKRTKWRTQKVSIFF